MEHRLEFRQMFDESFKRKVIEEYLSTRCTQAFLLDKYGIKFRGAIPTWMQKLGYTPGRIVLQPNFDKQILIPLPKKKKNEKPQDLEERIRQLEQQLEDEKLRAEIYSRIIDKAEKELKISLRKKPNTK